MYVGGKLADLGDQTPVDNFSHRVTRRVGSYMRARVAAHTPVAQKIAWEAPSDFVRRRGGRPPGTLKESWKVGEVTLVYGGRVMRVDVWTDDPVAPHVEWNTRPHPIDPKDPTGMLVFPTAGGVVFAKHVEHPGTTGHHMMATAVVETARKWREIAKRELAITTANWWRGGGDS